MGATGGNVAGEAPGISAARYPAATEVKSVT